MCQVRGTQTADEKFSAGLSFYQAASTQLTFKYTLDSHTCNVNSSKYHTNLQ